MESAGAACGDDGSAADPAVDGLERLGGKAASGVRDIADAVAARTGSPAEAQSRLTDLVPDTARNRAWWRGFLQGVASVNPAGVLRHKIWPPIERIVP